LGSGEVFVRAYDLKSMIFGRAKSESPCFVKVSAEGKGSPSNIREKEEKVRGGATPIAVRGADRSGWGGSSKLSKKGDRSKRGRGCSYS